MSAWLWSSKSSTRTAARCGSRAAKSALADQAAGIEAGADRYVIKPMALTQLVKMVDELLAQPVPVGACDGKGAWA